MKPFLVDVDATATPPQMTLCFLGRPNKFVVVPIRRRASTVRDVQLAAIQQLNGLTQDELARIADVARPAPVASDV